MATKYATLPVRQRLERRLHDMDECKANPVAWQQIQNKPEFHKQEKETRASLASITPPDTTGGERDRLSKRIALLQEGLVQGGGAAPPMPAADQMQAARPQDIDQHIGFEAFWKGHTITPDGKIVPTARGKGALWELKDLRRTLRRDEEVDQPNIANLETMRPRQSFIPLMDVKSRSYGLSPLAKANFDSVFSEEKARKPRALKNPCQHVAEGGKKCGWPAKRDAQFCFRHGKPQPAAE